jgi:hypothetical protein
MGVFIVMMDGQEFHVMKDHANLIVIIMVLVTMENAFAKMAGQDNSANLTLA